MSSKCCRLGAVRFGFALGLIWGLTVLVVAWVGWLAGYGQPAIRVVSHLYLGLSPTFIGGIIGGIWGFIDFFIFGWLVALVYNACGGKQSD